MLARDEARQPEYARPIDTMTARPDASARPTLPAPATDEIDRVEAMLRAEGAERDAIMREAGALRDEGADAAGRGGLVTYSRKVFVPVTTLCRDRCHYCVFVDTPGQLGLKRAPLYLDDDHVLRIARAGARQGCKEVLLTLGDRPEDRWPEARAWLDERGFASTIDYVAHVARLVTAETGLLAHANPGVMTHDELRMLRGVAPSMGMMLETTSRALYETPGAAHYGSPDKDPAVRLRVLEDAGDLRIPFTTGILVGIGESIRDRAESLLALRDIARAHGHVQEVIVQNFRAKDGTAMRGRPDAAESEHLAAIAVARLVLGPHARVQVPPNLADPGALDRALAAGADDLGGISPLTADHVNPERPWPHLDELADAVAASGFALVERLTAQPEYVRGASEWIDAGLHSAVAAFADPVTGLARASSTRRAGAGAGAPGTGTAGTATDAPARGRIVATGARPRATPALAERAADDATALDDAEWEALLRAEGAALEALRAAADAARRESVGEAVSIVVNRNLTSSGLRDRPDAPGEFSLADAADIARDAAERGATELCIQGVLPATEDPEGYLRIADAARAAAPGLHLHALRPQDVADLADRSGFGVGLGRGVEGAFAAMRAAGVRTFPGTGVKVLSERVRRIVAPGDLDTARWEEVVRAGHAAGFRSSSVLFYGHVETGAERIAHLRAIRAIQADTGGFTEFVPAPFPGPAGGVPLVPGRAPADEHAAMTAVSRLFLAGAIAHIQAPWPRVGASGAAALLGAGADDLGGTLLVGLRPDAGVESGTELPVADAARLARRLLRPLRIRTTTYGDAS